jgi:hypothetical protein
VFSNAASIYATHGYSEGVDYAAIHIEETGLPVIFVPMAIATPGTVGRFNTSGNTGTSVVSVAAGGSGSLDETDGEVVVVTGGTVGTSQIVIDLSLDGGRSYKTIKIGTASSYVIPYVGLTLSFAGGTLVAGDTALTWHSTAPMWNSTGMTAAKTALQNQTKQIRNWMVMGEVSDATTAGYVTTAVNAYETASERYCYAKVQVRDRLPAATLSQSRVSMTGSPTITFAEVGATGDTITRGSGSFITDGFVNGDTIRVTGAVASGGANNVTGVVANVAATVLTLDTTDLVNEGPISGVSITSEPTLTFAEVGGTGDTITLSRGSFLTDGFRSGDTITVTGTSGNNVTGAITTAAALVLTMGSTDLGAEVIGSYGVSITAGETKAVWVAAMDSAMATVSSQKRVDLGLGRGRKLSPFLQHSMRRPVQWADNVRAFQHDLHIPTWKKANGPCDGWDLNDADGVLYEFDERVDGGALSGGFTCFRTWGNGPAGAFIALSLTRAAEASPLSRTHNMAVADVAQSVCQAEAENAIGESLILNDDGTATQESLNAIKQRVDSSLKRNLLADLEGEGQRASNAYWTPRTDDDLSVADATLNGVLTLNLRGTIEHINTIVKVNLGG